MTEYNSDELLRLLQGVEPDSDFDVEWESTSEEDDNEAQSNNASTLQQAIATSPIPCSRNNGLQLHITQK
ncbi:hypothetical protein HF086_007413 [Spodoptera exigua]|uniref:Uncharacterized protein n=1 Tax=Spodoptera exigua TaxID=7107 RepID=A0A922M881_SPOEX|nr:hypothetical protein HF086_007413 [Spodoptera exigua]